MTEQIATRPSTAADASLLYALFTEEKAAELASLGLTAQALQPLLEMQYRGRELTYNNAYSNLSDSILCLHDGTPVGRLLVDRQPDCCRVIDLAVLTAFRGRGIASRALQQMQHTAARESLPVRLRVNRTSPALPLYQRLGFSAMDGDPLSFEMEWTPPAATREQLAAGSSCRAFTGVALLVACLVAFVPSVYGQAVLAVTPGATAGTVAGTGIVGYSGDNGAATSATFASPSAIAYDPSGDLFIADTNNNVIREVSASGVVTTVAGNGVQGYSGDGSTATAAELNAPTGLAVDAAGNLYIADSGNNRIRKVSGGVITTIAGTGIAGYSGDGGPATAAALDQPSAVAVDGSGNLFIADTDNFVIREVSNGTIATVAGNGQQGYSGDGGAATSASLDTPSGVAVDAADDLYIADTHNQRIRKVSSGVITTVAGSGPVTFSGAYSGDGGSATSASLARPTEIAIDGAGNIYVADTNNHRLRKVGNGSIATIAGTGAQGYGGDGAVATAAQLNTPRSVAVSSSGNAVIADTQNQRVRGFNLPTLTYTSQGVGIASSPQYVTIANSGSGTLVVQTISISSGYATASGGTCTALPISLNSGQSCTQAIVFQPTSAGASLGSLVVSGSGVVPQTILLSGTATQSAVAPVLTSSANPSVFGGSVTFTAVVGLGSTPTPTGAITFYDGATKLQAVAMSGGSARYSTASLAVGQHSITADYSGDAAWEAENSSVFTQTVDQATPSITLTSSASAALLENPITLTATVAFPNGVPTGTVTFLDGGTPIGSTPLNAGQASITVSSLASGSHSITAVYSGDIDFAAVTSGVVSEQVADFSLNFAAGSVTSVSIAPGGAATYKLIVSPTGAATSPQAINLSATNLPAGANASFSPATIPAGAGTTTVILTIQLASPSAMLNLPAHDSGQSPLYLGLVLLPLADIRRNRTTPKARDENIPRVRRRPSAFLLAAALSLIAIAGIAGCGTGSGFFSHSSQNYTITVTGTAGPLSHSATVQLNVK